MKMKPGLCVLCEKADPATRLFPLHTYELSDGSKIQIHVCPECEPKADSVDKKELWQTIVDDMETEITKHGWTDQQKEEYMARYSKLSIK